MKHELKMHDHQEFHGMYKGIYFEIVKWKRDIPVGMEEFDQGYTWNYYIYVKPRKLIITPKWKTFPKHVNYSKMYHDVDLTGGITYFQECLSSGMFKSHKIGCDYAHSWNSDERGKRYEYFLEDIQQDVKKAIDKLPKNLFFKTK